MEAPIQALSKSQVRYIFENLNKDLFESSTIEIAVNKSNVNYDLVKEILTFLSTYSSAWKEKIQSLIIESEYCEEEKQAVAMDLVTGGVLVTGIFTAAYLVLKLKNNKKADEDAVHATLLKLLKQPSPEVRNLLLQLYSQTTLKENKLDMSIDNIEKQKIIIYNFSKYAFNSGKANIKFDQNSNDKE